jgi:hypothetical protein
MTEILWRASLLALLVACTSCSGKKDESGAASSESQPVELAKVEAPKSSEEAKDSIDETVDQIVAHAAKLPREEFEPAALASSLGKDPNAHFEWVRDHTSWAPYRGLLRGPQGVMLDRIGSSLDRAVLLGDLLRRAGYTVRLARAQLSESQARDVLGMLLPMPERKMPSGRDDSVASARKLVQRRRMSDARYPRAVSTSGDDENRTLAALRDHWWVEREDDGNWVAMDVLRADAKMGEALVQSSSKSSWKSEDAAPSIPDSDWHSVQMRIVVERYEAGERRNHGPETDICPLRYRRACDAPSRAGALAGKPDRSRRGSAAIQGCRHCRQGVGTRAARRWSTDSAVRFHVRR